MQMQHTTAPPKANGVDRAAINKANAQHSTGPRTAAGKQRSSLNAMRHGLTGQVIVLPTEDLAAYQRHTQAFLDEYQPKGVTESHLVQSLLDTAWLFERATAIDMNLLTLGIMEMEDLVHANHPDAEIGLAMARAYREHNRASVNIAIQRQRLGRQYERTLVQLRQIQADRRATEARQLEEAAKILKMHKAENPSQPAAYNPSDDGFVFSTDQIEAFVRRQDRSEQASSHDFYADS
jgi:hypothetical protein